MSDMINSPGHYQGACGLEAIDVIEAIAGLDGHVANAVKYILRHQHKGRPAEDLAKARWYVQRLLAVEGRVGPVAELPAAVFDVWFAAFDLSRDGHWGNAAFAMSQIVIAITSHDRGYYQRALALAETDLTNAIAEFEAAKEPA